MSAFFFNCVTARISIKFPMFCFEYINLFVSSTRPRFVFSPSLNQAIFVLSFDLFVFFILECDAAVGFGSTMILLSSMVI